MGSYEKYGTPIPECNMKASEAGYNCCEKEPIATVKNLIEDINDAQREAIEVLSMIEHAITGMASDDKSSSTDISGMSMIQMLENQRYLSETILKLANNVRERLW